jgi:probable phosphoglycerate mutase
MTKSIYFIRHGETEYNKLGIVQGSGVDSELNTTGRAQAQAFYDHYQDVDFQLVIASALQRTHQTVEPFLEKRKLPFETTPLINEINWGIHEGQKYEPSMKDAYQNMINEWSIGNFDVSLEQGESARSLADRLQQFLDQLVQREEDKILVCTHGRTLRCLMCLIKGQHLREMENYSHNNTGLYQTKWINPNFEVILENDISHLNSIGLHS